MKLFWLLKYNILTKWWSLPIRPRVVHQREEPLKSNTKLKGKSNSIISELKRKHANWEEKASNIKALLEATTYPICSLSSNKYFNRSAKPSQKLSFLKRTLLIKVSMASSIWKINQPIFPSPRIISSKNTWPTNKNCWTMSQLW